MAQGAAGAGARHAGSRRWRVILVLAPVCAALAALVAVRAAEAAPVPAPMLSSGMDASALPALPDWRWPRRAAASIAELVPVSGTAHAVALVRTGGGAGWRPSRDLDPDAAYRLALGRPVSLLGVDVGWRTLDLRRVLKVAPRPALRSTAPSAVWRGRVLDLSFTEPLRSVEVTAGTAREAVRAIADAGGARWSVLIGPATPYGAVRLSIRFTARRGPMPGTPVAWRVRVVPTVRRTVSVAGEATPVVRDAMQEVTVAFSQPMRPALPAGWSASSAVWRDDRMLVLLPAEGWSAGVAVRTLGRMWSTSGRALAPPLRLRFDLGSGGPPPEEWFGPAKGGHIYVTIDDGWTPSPSALRLLVGDGIPFTTFLEGQAVEEHPAFWREVLRDEGHVGDHTVTHPSLTGVDDAGIREEVVGDARILEGLGAPPPVWFRPPYGAIDTRVLAQLGKAGVRRVVMWSAVMSDGKLTTYDGRPLRAGEIVLFHWVPGLTSELRELVSMAHADGLRFAALPGMPGPKAAPGHRGGPSA